MIFGRRRRELRVAREALHYLYAQIREQRIDHRQAILRERSRFAECDLRRKRQTERRAMHERQATLWEQRARAAGWDGDELDA